MPYKRGGSYGRRRSSPLAVVTSIKNIHRPPGFGISVTQAEVILAKAVTSPSPTVTNDVSHGCLIKNIWVSLDVCGLAASGVLAISNMYIAKNPGANLTLPHPESTGGSNEKKFIFKQWQAMTMRNQDGNVPYHWEGWIKIPKLYQRMGTDDTIVIVFSITSGTTGHGSVQGIYKWFR